MPEDFCLLPISELAPLLQTRRLSPVELTRAFLDRIHILNPKLKAYITILDQEAMRSAYDAEKEISQGHYRGPLHGIPVAVKDNFASRGSPTTSGSRLLTDNITDFDATAVFRLKEAGAILLGKLTMSEFAAGDDFNPFTGRGPTRNPWNPNCSAGGSSSGSGAGVAASLCVAALGTDTAGSIRIPSAYNGIVGMKPTFGRVSRFGVAPLSGSLDHVGPMTKTVRDNELMLEAISGPDAKDPACSTRIVSSFRQQETANVKGLRMGLPKKYFLEYVTRDIADAVYEAARLLEKQGAILSEVDLPHLQYTVGTAFAILLPEALAYHTRYLRQGKIDLYSESFRDTVLTPAHHISATEYIHAQKVRKFIIHDFERAFTNVDVILAPGCEIAAPVQDDNKELAQYQTQRGLMDWLEMWPQIHCPANLAGVPSLVLPCGFSKAGLPLSLAILGKHFDEAMVYRVAHAYESQTDWHKRHPNV